MTFEIQNGCFGYEAGRQILSNVCVRLGPAKIMTVLGANGVGKTTLMKCMLGLLAWTGGESRIDGVNVHDIPYTKLWTRIGYVPQARQAAFAYTAEEMVLLGRSAHLGLTSQPRERDRQIAREPLGKELHGQTQHMPHEGSVCLNGQLPFDLRHVDGLNDAD